MAAIVTFGISRSNCELRMWWRDHGFPRLGVRERLAIERHNAATFDRHVAGFIRLGCEFRDKGRTVLPVASAGSASHPQPDDTRGHHFNLIEIFDDDTAQLKSWFFGGSTESIRQFRPDVLVRFEGIFQSENRASTGCLHPAGRSPASPCRRGAT